MADYKFEDSKLLDGRRNKIGALDGKYIRDERGNKLGEIDGKYFRDERGNKLAEFDGRDIRDPRGSKIGTIDDLIMSLSQCAPSVSFQNKGLHA